MNSDQTGMTVVRPGAAARGLASPSVRYGLLAGFGVIGALVVWRMFSPAHEQKMPKSKAEVELEKIMETSKKAGSTANVPQNQNGGKQSDQPTGDTEAIAALNQVEATKNLEARRKADAEDKMLANLAYQNYIRRAQGLKYDPELVAEWERRQKEAQAKGMVAQIPGEMTPESLEEVKRTQPELYAKWMAMRGEKGGAPAPGLASAPAMAKGAPGAQAAGAPGTVPGIDPKTGLPAQVVNASSLPEDVLYALLEDGSPDIARGAIPITIQFDIPGSKDKITKTVWVRPGYLTGRMRPMDPGQLREEDEAFRRSMKDSTDVPAEGANSISIPYRYTNSRVRVAPAGDFNFQNHYVVVLPNPKGKLTPPNPAQPKTGGQK